MSDLKNISKKPVEQKETLSRSTGKIRISTKRRIIQRVIFALIFSVAIIAAHKAGWLDNISHQLGTQKINWRDNKEVTQHLRKVIANNKLSDTPSNCLVFVINNDIGGDIVDLQVREQHNNTCTNTRNDFPLLFTFRVNRTNGNIQIDKGSPNYFYPIH